MRLEFLSCLLIALCNSSVQSLQSYSVHGQLICPGQPEKAVGVYLKMQDLDGFNIGSLDFDDEMGDTRTNATGHFNITGSATEGGTDNLPGIRNRIDTMLKISHSCYNKWWISEKYGANGGNERPCNRYWRLLLPDTYINANSSFYVGVLNLEMQLEKERWDCWEGH